MGHGHGTPYLDPDTMIPLWTADVKSPLIDRGDPDTNGNGLSWMFDPEDRDPDGTRLDIGAIPHLHGIIRHDLYTNSMWPLHDFADISTPRSEPAVQWVSFPWLDKRYDPPGFTRSVMSFVLGPHHDNNLFDVHPIHGPIVDSIIWNTP
jgi:hypothetical protein